MTKVTNTYFPKEKKKTIQQLKSDFFCLFFQIYFYQNFQYQIVNLISQYFLSSPMNISRDRKMKHKRVNKKVKAHFTRANEQFCFFFFSPHTHTAILFFSLVIGGCTKPIKSSKIAVRISQKQFAIANQIHEMS